MTLWGMLGLIVLGEGIRDVLAAAWAVAVGGVFVTGALFMVGVGYAGQAVYEGFGVWRRFRRGGD